MLSQKKSLQGVGQPFFRNTCKDSSFVLEFEDETVKIPLESRVGNSSFTETKLFPGSWKTVVAGLSKQNTFKGFSMLFLMNFSLGL